MNNNGTLSLNQHDEIKSEVSDEEFRLADELGLQLQSLSELVSGNYGHTEITAVSIKRSRKGIYANVSYKRSMYLRTY